MALGAVIKQAISGNADRTDDATASDNISLRNGNMNDTMEQHSNDEDARVSTGVEGLDDVLNGGFPEGHFFLIEGEPGTGKTTLGLQILMQGARTGQKSLYVTLSESKREIEQVAHSHRWSLE